VKQSELEELFAQQVKDRGLPEPSREEVIIPGRKHRYDFCWKRYRLAVEINGGTHTKSGHTTHAGITRDYWKVRRAQDNNWIIYPFTGDDVKDSVAIDEVAEHIDKVDKGKLLWMPISL
jgi:very-short-patch-repair endonuclease